MNEKLGPVSYTENPGQVFLGRDLQRHKGFSNESSRMIDDEVRRILTECYDRACTILKENYQALEHLTQTLIEKETVNGEEVAQSLRQSSPA